jgi:G3E family GTPase
MPAPRVIPITILTGFLGAGKTTLLNRILNGTHGLRVAVLVNDFGAINIDADLVVGVRDNVVSLANGCVCCTIRDDLVETVIQTIDRPEAPEYILLEASGVADPSGIAMTFADPNLRERIRLDNIACVIDADQVFAYPEYPALIALKLRQVAFSDMVILNKTDLAAPEQLDKVRAWLHGTFGRLRVVETSHCDVPLEILLSVERFDSAATGHAGCAVPHGSETHDADERDVTKAFSTWIYETDRPLALEALREVVRKLPGNVYRAKGIVYTSDTPEQPAVLQVVGRRVDISIQNEWGKRMQGTRIVAIGAPGSFDAGLLDAAFATCI